MLQQPKSSDSIILLAMVGPEYEFLFVDVGMNGRNSDGGNWSQTRLKNGLEKNTLNFPDPAPLPGRNYPLPYVCTGDDAFPRTAYMMKPYPQENLSLEKRIFNYQLSRMKRISENAFGILVNCWRVFRKPFFLEPEKVKAITLALLTLYNWLRKESDIDKVYFSPTVNREYAETGEIIEGSWRKEILTESWKSLSNTRAHNPANEAKTIREEFTDYITNEGCIPWQWKCARVDI